MEPQHSHDESFPVPRLRGEEELAGEREPRAVLPGPVLSPRHRLPPGILCWRTYGSLVASLGAPSPRAAQELFLHVPRLGVRVLSGPETPSERQAAQELGTIAVKVGLRNCPQEKGRPELAACCPVGSCTVAVGTARGLTGVCGLAGGPR